MEQPFNIVIEKYKVYIEAFSNYLFTVGYNKSTREMLPACLREFLYFQQQKGIHTVNQILTENIYDYYQYISSRPNRRGPGNLSGSMVNHHMFAIRLFFSYLEQSGETCFNPTGILEFKRLKSNPKKILTLLEIEKLYQACQTLRDRALLGIYYGCGLRRCEGEKINREDINFTVHLLHVRDGKGGQSRTMPVHESVNNDFKDYYHNERCLYIRKTTPDNHKAFLLNNRGNRMNGESCNNRLKQLISLVDDSNLKNKNISLHSLRHSIATHLLENGLPVESVRDFLGHKHLESTQVYTHINLQLLKNL